MILVYGIDHSEWDLIVRGVRGWLELRPSQDEWLDYPAVLTRDFVSH